MALITLRGPVYHSQELNTGDAAERGDTPKTIVDGVNSMMVDLYAAVAANPAVVSMPRRALLLGNSITNQNATYSAAAWPANITAYNNEGWFTWANRFLNHRLYLDPTLEKGVDGDTTAGMVARYAADVTANYANFDILFFACPATNDVEAGTAAATSIANIQSIITSAMIASKTVVYILDIPRDPFKTDATKRTKLNYINTVMKIWALGKPGLLVVDCWRDLADPTVATGAVVAAAYEGTGVHPNPLGAYYMGKRIADLLSPLLPLTPDFLSGGVDVYHATDNPFGNRLTNPAFLTGSGGTASTPCTGTVVGSWTLMQLAGTFVATNCVGSVVSSTAGYGAYPGKKQVITFAASAKTAQETFQLVQSVTGLSAGDQIALSCEVDVTNISNLLNLELRIGESDNAQFPISAADGYNVLYAGAIPTTALTQMKLRTPNYTVKANGRTLYCALVGALDATASASATISVGGMRLNKVA